MVITVIGWYGTETIGDRAIFAGILNLFGEILTEFTINLGSLVPEFTSRTLLEDKIFYEQISRNRLKAIRIFNSLEKSELKTAIKHSDLLIVGGGPLMDITQMHMITYAFKYAKNKKIKRAVLGVGWGPLKNPEYISSANSIILNSDITIFRDKISLNEFIKNIRAEEQNQLNLSSSIDPAFFCADYYVKQHNKKYSGEKYVAVNFRDVSKDQYYGDSKRNDEIFIELINDIIKKYDLSVHLIPMHTFYLGGDDRSQFNRLALKIKNPKVLVHNDPPSLTEVMELFRNASICVGMRFHSIVLQTILNGRNIILDYTDPEKGKIKGMIDELNLSEVYKGRYFSLLENKEIRLDDFQTYKLDDAAIEKYKNIYIEKLGNLLGNSLENSI